jgi:isopropylmalate/homocitrate/citramalate synthase
MEKRGFGLSKNEVLETAGRYVNENKIPTPFRGGVPGDKVFIPFKGTHKRGLKKPQRVEACRKISVIYPIIISEEVITSGEVRERIKEIASKTREREEQTRKKKTTKKKEDNGDSEQLKPQAAI